MRANSPVDSDFGVLAEPEEESPIQKLTPEVKQLAKAAMSKEGQIILDHLQARVEHYTQVLKGLDVTTVDPVTGLARVMAAQQVISEFETVLQDVEISKAMVKEAAQASYVSSAE